MTYHLNPKTTLLGTIRRVIKLTNKEWMFEGIPEKHIGPSFAYVKEEDVVFHDTCFSIKIKDKIIITYEYVY